jgi:hypothetical protein
MADPSSLARESTTLSSRWEQAGQRTGATLPGPPTFPPETDLLVTLNGTTGSGRPAPTAVAAERNRPGR